MEERLSDIAESEFPLVEDCFDAAFADYALKGKPARLWLWNRCVKNGVDLARSAAAWSAGRVVGFTLVGLDDWAGLPAAYDAGTGIVPEHRGRGLAGRLFEHLLPQCSKRGTSRFILEVLQENEAAVSAYRKAGFDIERELDCFSLEAEHLPCSSARQEAAVPTTLEEALDLHDRGTWLPSWENSAASIRRIRGKLKILGIRTGGRLVGELIFDPTSGWLHSLFVLPEHRGRGLAGALIATLVSSLPSETHLQAVNLDRRDSGSARALAKLGFRLFTSQFEMHKILAAERPSSPA